MKRKPKYVSTWTTAKRWGISPQMVARYVEAGRVRGAKRVTSESGRVEIMIPARAVKPVAMASGPKPKKGNK